MSFDSHSLRHQWRGQRSSSPTPLNGKINCQYRYTASHTHTPTPHTFTSPHLTPHTSHPHTSLSHCHTAAPSHCQTPTLPHPHTVTPPHCHTSTLSHSHTVTPPHCHTPTPSLYHTPNRGPSPHYFCIHTFNISYTFTHRTPHLSYFTLTPHAPGW